LSNFLRRSLTAVWIVIFILGGLWLHPVTFIITGIVLLTGTQYEYYMMIKSTGIKPQMWTGIVIGLAVYAVSTLIATKVIPPDWFIIIVPMVAAIMIAELYRKQDKPFDSLAHTFFPILYTTIPFSMFTFSAFGHIENAESIHSLLPNNFQTFSPGIMIGFFVLLWINDSGAYVVGASFGKHRLFERISPKKSWEGFFGGLIISALIAWFFSGFLGILSRGHWIIISVIISVVGTYGDLVESMLKRSIGVKDSGNIMPGHGGFLDRFDSVILSFPLVYLYIFLFAK
jgi:phosphatidate cytidylyltransferase